MRFVVLLLVALSYGVGWTQSQTKIYALSGLTRIGVRYEVGAEKTFNAHAFSFGLTLYAPSLIFDKTTPGFNLTYKHYFRPERKTKLQVAIGTSLFYETDEDSDVLFIDPRFQFGPFWNIGNRSTLGILAGVGSGINRVKNSFLTKNQVYTFLNYEMALCFTYAFHSGSSR